MKITDDFPVSFLIYASAVNGECSRYCRVTFDRGLSTRNDEFLYGRLSLKSKDDAAKIISTASFEQRNFPSVEKMLNQLKDTGEVMVTHTTAQLVLKDIFNCALSLNFPEFSHELAFDFAWFPESRRSQGTPVRVTVTT